MSNTTLDQIRKALIDVQRAGHASVDVQALQTFLNSVEAELPIDAEIRRLNHDSQLAQYKAEHDRHLAYYRASADAENEMFKSVIATAKTALSTSILVNGGATVALLAFLGNVMARSSQGVASSVQSALVCSLLFFATGVLLGAAATGTTYSAQYCYHNEYKRSGVTFHVLTVVLVVSTYVAFAGGLVSAYHGFLPRGAI